MKGVFIVEVMNNIAIVQNYTQISQTQVQNEYHFYTGTGIYLGAVILPSDRQFFSDSKTLNIITRALALRWQLIQPKRTN